MATPIPENQARFTLAGLLGATGGRLVGPAFAEAVGVTTDSRAKVQDKVFVALRGENFDGHRFVHDVLRRGARAAVVEAGAGDAAFSALPVVVVPDSLRALGDLALHHRGRLAAKIVAVGGSAGKTTTRRTIAAALSAGFGARVHSASGNLNNRIGVPAVLLALTEEHRYAVIEVGTNCRGEVAEIARIAKPDCAVLTRVGLEHTLGLGSLDEIEAEEGDLLRRLPQAGVAIANGDDERAARQLTCAGSTRRASYGRRAGSRVRLLQVRSRGDLRSELDVSAGGHALTLPMSLLGEPGALAVCAALTVLLELEPALLDEPSLTSAFLTGSERGRLCPVLLADGTLVIDDSYNSNPVSVESSLGVALEVARLRQSRLVLVLGEMLELGGLSEREHWAVGRRLCDFSPSVVVTIAGAARFIADAARDAGVDALHAETADEAWGLLSTCLASGDTVLVKASRGVRAERVVEALIRERGRAA